MSVLHHRTIMTDIDQLQQDMWRLATATHDLLRGSGFNPELTVGRMAHQLLVYVTLRQKVRASQLSAPLHERVEPRGWGGQERAWTEFVMDSIKREEWDAVITSIFGTDELRVWESGSGSGSGSGSEWRDEVYLFLPLWARRSLNVLDGFSGSGGNNEESGIEIESVKLDTFSIEPSRRRRG